MLALVSGGEKSRARNYSKIVGISSTPKLCLSAPKRDASDPFHHDTSKYGRRLVQKHVVRGKCVKFVYPHRPTEEQQCALAKLPAVVCSTCSTSEMREKKCHAMWMLPKLRKKFGLPSMPDLLSAAISPNIIARAKESGDWSKAVAIHRYAFLERKACHISHCRGCHTVPRLLEGVKMGVSLFSNPFADVPVKQSRALFKRYLERDFRPLPDDEVVAIMMATECRG